MARFVIALNEANAINRTIIDSQGASSDIIDWVPALLAVALEVQELNNYVGMLGLDPNTGESAFPRPISCNPLAVQWIDEYTDEDNNTVDGHWEGQIEGIIGDLNTPPTSDGFVTVDVDNYEWINFRFLIQLPTTFFIIGGEPKHVGKII